jgi:hypothetical protein
MTTAHSNPIDLTSKRTSDIRDAWRFFCECPSRHSPTIKDLIYELHMELHRRAGRAARWNDGIR